LAAWADPAVATLRTRRPLRVDVLRDRSNEVWRPLLAIAELAGDAWAARARRAALALSAGGESDPSLGLLPVGDVRAGFDQHDVERLSTVDLIAYLGRGDESPWGEWWLDPKTEQPTKHAPRRLAKLLQPYGVGPRVLRLGERTAKGYRREDFV